LRETAERNTALMATQSSVLGTSPLGPRVSVVIVLHNSSETLARCLGSLPSGIEVIVVDNASTDCGAALAEALLPTAIIARSETNLGFSAGCNVGLREATGEVVVFLNPDAMLTAQAIDQLVPVLAEEDIGMVGPAIVTPIGAIEHSCRRWTTAWHAFIEHLPFADRWSPTRLLRDVPPGSAIYRHRG
jgi:GT2 family glycosyltransferase